MSEPDWMAGTIGSAEYEFAPLQGDRLGFVACFDRETGHHPRCRLRRRPNREQVGGNRHARQGLWHRSFDRERGNSHANEHSTPLCSIASNVTPSIPGAPSLLLAI